jgi:myo-inositol-1(or 4)-monophosphatase
VADSLSLESLADLATSAARQAGALLVAGQPRRRLHVETKSSPTDMVSEMDKASEALIRSVLADARPGDAVLGEEGGSGEGSGDVRWIVDPLDGTTNYLYGFPAWSISVAAEVAGTVAAGVVYDPVRNELFRAVRGQGAGCNDMALRVSGATDLATALVGTGFAYERERRAEQATWLTRILPRVRDIRRAGSAALDLCWVAAGRLDAFYELGIQIWDFSAGALIAAEAGASVSGLSGGSPSLADGIVATAPGIADALRALLAEARAPDQP